MTTAEKRHKDGSKFGIGSNFDIERPSLSWHLIGTASELSEVLARVADVNRVAIDTEADSLHCYREKLCLLQISVPDADFVLDPLSLPDSQSIAQALKTKEIVLHGADFDLRLLRRGIGLVAERIFDTVIAARLLGQRQFSLAHLVHAYFGVELPKGSQKANWAQRPLPKRMLAYAVNDTHYLLGLAQRMEEELSRRERLPWFHQSCQRAIELAATDRTREPDEIWRVSGSGVLRGRAAAVLRELWRWREKEAEAVDRPAFHILQNEDLVRSAVSFDAGERPDFRHFSSRRRRAFNAAAENALQMDERQWPVRQRRLGTRRSAEANQRLDELRARRDRAAAALGLEPAFVASRAVLEAIATDESRASDLLVAWQRELLGFR